MMSYSIKFRIYRIICKPEAFIPTGMESPENGDIIVIAVYANTVKRLQGAKQFGSDILLVKYQNQRRTT